MPERTLRTRALLWAAHVAVRATLTVSPVVVVAISRKVYAAGGDRIRRALDALVTTPGYDAAVGVAPAITASQLRGLILACGPYDLGQMSRAPEPLARDSVLAFGWVYSGTRRFLDDPLFATWSVANYVTPAFPPALITVGNADGLRPQSELLAGELRRHGVQAETVFFAEDHEPPMDHEYQFGLDTSEAALFLERMLIFLKERLGSRDLRGRDRRRPGCRPSIPGQPRTGPRCSVAGPPASYVRNASV